MIFYVCTEQYGEVVRRVSGRVTVCTGPVVTPGARDIQLVPRYDPVHRPCETSGRRRKLFSEKYRLRLSWNDTGIVVGDSLFQSTGPIFPNGPWIP